MFVENDKTKYIEFEMKIIKVKVVNSFVAFKNMNKNTVKMSHSIA